MHRSITRAGSSTAMVTGMAIMTALAACRGQGVSPSLDGTGSIGSTAVASPLGPTSSFVSDARTLRTLASAADEASQLVVGAELSVNEMYTSHAATYTSDGLTISAVLHEPMAHGPHPGVVLVHGFVDPQSYLSGGELQREQDALARAGYVVLYTDLRGLAGSDGAPDGPPDLEMGMTVDVVNAIRALGASGLPGLDSERIGLLGHSLGGLLVLNVLAAKPGLVDAAVAFAPSNTDRWKDVEQYLTPGDPAYEAITAAYGTPQTNPGYWADVSPDTFVNQVSEPLLVVHGDADVDSPYIWSVDLVAAWQQAGKNVEFLTLEGEGHVFQARWNEAMDAVIAFFAGNLN
jgi:dipeptidyl aminopeptidase/acylaminoacyl peptidase